jgi:NAD(P)-dependent dehydrogenase (short-subunit alcohol dehydrogenase family)
VIACRSISKGKEVIAAIEKEVLTDARYSRDEGRKSMELLQMDVSDMKSIDAAVTEFQNRFRGQLDVLILNAGVYPFVGYDWMYMLKCCAMPWRMMQFLETGGDFLIEPKQTMMENGKVGDVFATNTLGHMLLVERVRGMLVASSTRLAPTRVVWTGSRSCRDFVMDWKDPQSLEGRHPYRNSKYAVDLLVKYYNQQMNATASSGFDDEKNKQPVLSFTCCPGAVFTPLTPQWLLYIKPIFYFLGLFIPNFCRIDPEDGCEVQYRLATIDIVTSGIIAEAGKFEMQWNKLHVAPAAPAASPTDPERMHDYCKSLLKKYL